MTDIFVQQLEEVFLEALSDRGVCNVSSMESMPPSIRKRACKEINADLNDLRRKEERKAEVHVLVDKESRVHKKIYLLQPGNTELLKRGWHYYLNKDGEKVVDKIGGDSWLSFRGLDGIWKETKFEHELSKDVIAVYVGYEDWKHFKREIRGKRDGNLQLPQTSKDKTSQPSIVDLKQELETLLELSGLYSKKLSDSIMKIELIREKLLKK